MQKASLNSSNNAGSCGFGRASAPSNPDTKMAGTTVPVTVHFFPKVGDAMASLEHSRRTHKMRFGAEEDDFGTTFQLWAPKCRSVRLRIKGRGPLRMERDSDGWHRLRVDRVGAGTYYKFLLPRAREVADPASRFQPNGLDGYSEVIRPADYVWQNPTWSGRPWEETVIYELHVGCFTREGTWAAATKRLDDLAALGVTAIQIMPLAQCYGDFNWGYDGGLWFAPSSSYGRPEAMKAFVDAAHARSLMVFLDVVYNHFGAVGNNLSLMGPIFTDRHASPWGEAINLDGPGSAEVRQLIVENALYWLTEFNLDGLRFDAVHTLFDDSNTHLLELLAARLKALAGGRHLHLIVENSDNQERWLRRDTLLRPVHYTAQWNDDLHHVLHAAASGETTGYFADFDNTTPKFEKLGRALAEGFAFQGEMKKHEGQRRGEPSQGLPPTAFVTYMQNHDQVGNRIKGDRIHQVTEPDAVRAFASVVLLSPQIPMIFMGEEFGVQTPFPFFSDMPPELRDKTFKGRVEELKKTPEHDDPVKDSVEETLDPTDHKTFLAAKLDWQQRQAPVGRQWLSLYRSLLDLRHREIVPRLHGINGFSSHFERLGENAVLVTWQMGDGSHLRLYLNLSGSSQTDCPAIEGRQIWLAGHVSDRELAPWTVLWTIEV
jgi:maltooligosyltrehalose trehalohydrolase